MVKRKVIEERHGSIVFVKKDFVMYNGFLNWIGFRLDKYILTSRELPKWLNEK